VAQPELHLFLQHRPVVPGIMPPTVYQADATSATRIRGGQKAIHQTLRLLDRIAVQVEMRLDRKVAMVQSLCQPPIYPWGNALHILIGILDGKGAAAVDEVLQIGQGFRLWAKGLDLLRRLPVLFHTTAPISWQWRHPCHLG
jgi:hypothetical protein